MGSGLTGGKHSGTGTGVEGAGPHRSGMENKLDPRVDSDRDGSRGLGNETRGSGLTGGDSGFDNERGTGLTGIGGAGDSGFGNETRGTGLTVGDSGRSGLTSGDSGYDNNTRGTGLTGGDSGIGGDSGRSGLTGGDSGIGGDSGRSGLTGGDSGIGSHTGTTGRDTDSGGGLLGKAERYVEGSEKHHRGDGHPEDTVHPGPHETRTAKVLDPHLNQ